MNFKKVIIILGIIFFIILLVYIFKQYNSSKRTDVSVPILLYHNFVTTVPDSDPDNFNYINTPESFCEMTGKEILEEIEK